MDNKKRNLWSKVAETVGVCIVQALAELLLKGEKEEDSHGEKQK